MNAVSKLAVFGFVLSGASAGASFMAAFEGLLLPTVVGAAISVYIFFGAVKEQESFGK